MPDTTQTSFCPTPAYHETHNYCPSCPWTRTPEGKIHVLKTAPAPWMSVRAGVKTAEFRRDDRGFEVNDILDLRCITEDGASILKRITHIVRGPLFGIPEGYAMLSLGDPYVKVSGDYR